MIDQTITAKERLYGIKKSNMSEVKTMKIDPCPSEDDYIHPKELKALDELKIKIKDAWEIYNILQQKHMTQTGQRYKWFK